jgi:hypothetical protein
MVDLISLTLFFKQTLFYLNEEWRFYISVNYIYQVDRFILMDISKTIQFNILSISFLLSLILFMPIIHNILI